MKKKYKKIQFYNSLSNSMEDFIPIDSENIRVYSCGPTVYASPHIGNARPIVIFDVLFRLLSEIYDGKVTFVRNITDVDDKINNRARELGISIRELTDKVIEEFHTNIAKLNVRSVTYEPRATDHISDMLKIIKILIDNGYAYEAEGHVLFRVKKLEQYGMLSKRNLDEMIAGSRVEIAPYKENPMDFVLWKPSKEGEPSWKSEYSNGRPGWHIECSAMSSKYLRTQFDIHVGGHDLIFPHHENEIAQNFGAFGKLMAKYWLHNGMLLIDNQKMSKSLGNIISLDDILKKYDGEIIRYVLLSSHYQKTLNWTEQAIHQAKQALNRLYRALRNEDNEENRGGENSEKKNEASVENYSDSPILDALCSNLNTPLALTRLHEIADRIYKFKTTNRTAVKFEQNLLKKEASYLGLLNKNPADWFKFNLSLTDISSEKNVKKIAKIEKMISDRSEAKKNKNYQKADEIREELLKIGIQIEDTKNGTVWKELK